MKKITTQVTVVLLLLATKPSDAQNVGIGISNPQQKLEVNGAIKLGSNDAVAPAPGTMRWNNAANQFEGFDGIQWVKFGNSNAFGNSGAIGDTNHYSYESGIYDPKFMTALDAEFPYFGTSLVAWKNYYISGAPYYFMRTIPDGIDVPRAGKVGIFQRSANGAFLPHGTIVSPAPAQENAFGLAIAADDQRFIIGEPKAGPSFDRGKVHIYSDVNVLEKTIAANDAVSGDEFGSAVGIKNNFAVVGAAQKTDGGVRRGKLYIYKRNTTDGQWVLHQSFIGTVGGMQYGKDVGITSEFIAAGSPGAALNGFAEHGAVFMYQYNASTGNWAYHSQVKPADGLAHKGFGAKLLLRGDTLMVAEHPLTAGSLNRLFMFIRINNVWTQVHEFVIPGSTPGDGAFTSFDFKGNRVVVGQPSAYIGGIANGLAHLFEWNGSWSHRTVLRPTDPSTRKRFGYSVLFGPQDILCGAIEGNGEFNHSGLIYIFRTL